MGNLARADSVRSYPRNRNLYRKHIIMKYKTKKELEQMPFNKLLAHHNKLELRQTKLESLIMGFCLGGTICTVLMYAVHVGF